MFNCRQFFSGALMSVAFSFICGTSQSRLLTGSSAFTLLGFLCYVSGYSVHTLGGISLGRKKIKNYLTIWVMG